MVIEKQKSLRSKTFGIVEISLFMIATLMISQLSVWPIPAINGFFAARLDSNWNYGFLCYKILLVAVALLVFNRSLIGKIFNRGKNRSAFLHGLALMGILFLPTLLEGIIGATVLRPLDGAVVFGVILFQLINDSVEEITYRGYILEKMDLAFGKKWKFAGISAGPGFLVSAFLFGMLHALNPFNPFAGSLEIDLLWGLTTFGTGLFLAYVREFSGSIIPCIMLHVIPDIIGNLTEETGVGGVVPVIFACIAYVGIFLYFIFMILRRNKTVGVKD